MGHSKSGDAFVVFIREHLPLHGRAVEGGLVKIDADT